MRRYINWNWDLAAWTNLTWLNSLERLIVCLLWHFKILNWLIAFLNFFFVILWSWEEMCCLRIVLGQALESMESIGIYLRFSLVLGEHLSILDDIRVILFHLLVKLIHYLSLSLSRLHHLSRGLIAVAVPPFVAGVIDHWQFLLRVRFSYSCGLMR